MIGKSLVPSLLALLGVAGLCLTVGPMRPSGRALARADEPAEDKQAGWHTTFESLAGGGRDARRDRFIALYVPEKSPPTPFLPAGPFRAVWKAELNLDLQGDYTFSAEGRGSLRVEIDGAVALEASGEEFRTARAKSVSLKGGANVVVVRYESPARGPAVLRLRWASEEFAPEPIPLALVQHDPLPLSVPRRLRSGRELLANHRCLRCHRAEADTGEGLPEREADAPSLTEVGARLRPVWLARWVQDPTALRPGATMPRLFPDAARGGGVLDSRARDVAAYLATLGTPEGKETPPKKEAVEAGTRLFAQLGCIGCHTPPDRDDFAKDEHARIPLRDVSAKWRPKALQAFLRQPDRHYAWIRMPNFHLDADEAEQLTAYLSVAPPRDLFPADLAGADRGRGQKLVQAIGCLACHQVEAGQPLAPHPRAVPWAHLTKESWSRGCVAVRASTAPAYDLGEARVALQELAAVGPTSLGRESPAEFSARQLRTLRCNACHKRDGQDDVWTQVKEEADGLLAELPPLPMEAESKFPAEQARPPLTWVGEKLKPEWTTALLAGKLAYKPRPFLRARMPAFPRRAELLARGLAFEHGCPPSSPPDPVSDPKRAEVGRSLAAKNRWGCVGCHNVGSAAAVGVFESPGINFQYTRERIRRDYYDRWLWAPLRVESGTKMPTVFTYGKPSQIADVLDGDASKQIEALWNFLLEGHKIKPPPEP